MGGGCEPEGNINTLLGDLRAHYLEANLAPLKNAMPQEEEPTADLGARLTQGPAAALHHITPTSVSSTGLLLSVRARMRPAGFKLTQLLKAQVGDVWRISGVSEESREVIFNVRAATRPTKAMAPKRCCVEDFRASWKLADNSTVWEAQKAWPAARLCVSETAAPYRANAFVVFGLSHFGDTLDKRVRPGASQC